MAKKKKDIRIEPSEKSEEPKDPIIVARNKELIGKEKIKDACLDILKEVERGFQDQWERSNEQMDYWDLYNCVLGPKQFYTGNSKVFVPIIHDAVEARRTRFTNQCFPQSGKHVEVSATDDKPTAIMSLLEHYIRKLKLRTKIMPALTKNGDIEGQYNLYISWTRNERHIVSKVRKAETVDKLHIDDEAVSEAVELPGSEYEDIEEETIVHQYPHVEVLPDADVLVLPWTADSIDAAVENGGSVSIIRRWSKAKIKQLADDGEIDEDEADSLIGYMNEKMKGETPDKKGHVVDAAGVRKEKGHPVAQVYETWTKLNIDGERRIVRIYYGGEDRVLSCKRNPYWCDKVPILSAPQEKVEGSFKGVSKIKYVESYQLMASDAINEGMDAAAYALMPIIMTDPEKNPRIGSMVLNVAAIWETDPKNTQFAQFPPIWKDAFNIVGESKTQIFQTLGVNPAMMPQSTAGKKQNQAQIANEQQVDLLTTADAVTVLEGEMLTPLLQWFLWLDHQYRDDVLTIRSFGELGVQAIMEEIEPIQMDRHYEFRWYGVEAARNAQQVQQQISGLNVLRGIQPQYHPGYQINLVPIISQFIENTYGPRMANQIFVDVRKKLSLDAEFENIIMESGLKMPVNPMDDDAQHMQSHMQQVQTYGDMHGTIREHIIYHQMQMQQKSAQQQQAQQGAQGSPGGGGQPGIAGTPRQGAQVAGPRNGQGPPGMIHADQLRNAMPRPTRG